MSGPEWYRAVVSETRHETPRARSIALDVDGWPGHVPGQHVTVRLTAADGYQASRSYSIASAPESDGLELTVERMDDGEVSPYLVDELAPGDTFEIRGPIGGFFRWQAADGGPLLLVAGGSGLVPLMAMLRHRVATESDAAVRLLLSTRSHEDVLYRDELSEISTLPDIEIAQTLTREQPQDWTGFDRRIDRAMLEEAGFGSADPAHVFVCGTSGLAESVARSLVDLGHPPESIRTERFGKS